MRANGATHHRMQMGEMANIGGQTDMRGADGIPGLGR